MKDLLADISVVAETDEVVVVNKPAGLLVHPDGNSDEPSLCDWIRSVYPDIQGVGEPIERASEPDIGRPGIVHRLDRETSGVLVIARTQNYYEHIKKQFKSRTVDKEYDAFVYGCVQENTFTVNKPIGRSKGDSHRFQIPPHTRGKTRKAETDFAVQTANDTSSYLKAYPKTGRTHQIRVHLKSVHHPIVCDSLYAAGKECFWGLDRLGLHARRIDFELPGGSQFVAEATLPADLRTARDGLTA